MCDRHVIAGVEFAARAEPANGIRCLEHEDALTTLHQIGSANQAVVSGADNDGIVPIQFRIPFDYYYQSVR